MKFTPNSPFINPTSPTLLTTQNTMARSSVLSDSPIFAGLAAIALLLFWALFSLFAPASPNQSIFPSLHQASRTVYSHNSPPATFYDDPTLSYTIDHPITGWDEKRRDWIRLHPQFSGGHERILMVTGSQPVPCRNPIGDHLLLRFFKNKVDYCRLHNIPIFYNNVLLDPRMFTYWAKTPVLRAAMVAHPEAEWLWWVDSDAALTDMEFELPLSRYRNHNLILHGWPGAVENRSWTSLNAGVFLIRNCQWSLDFMDVWARFGPMSPEYEKWGKILKEELKDKLFPESDDQSALVYLLLRQKEKWGDKIYLEYQYYFEGYWVELVEKLENTTERYLEMERRAGPILRRRRAEVMAGTYGRMREKQIEAEGWRAGFEGERRPFITHFTGCQPCSGDQNKIYSGENCYEGMQRALNFADDQVLRAYGFRHTGLLNTSDVVPLSFDFPTHNA